MAKAVLILEVDAAAGKAEVKSFGAEVDAAFERIKKSAGSVTPAIAAVDDKINQMLRNIPGHVRPAEDAFQALGIRSTAAIETARGKITSAFDSIRNSGTVSGAELMRAEEAREKQLKKLADEATPNLIGKQKELNASNAGVAASLSGVDAWLNKAGINTGLFGKAISALVSPAGLAAVALSALVLITSSGVAATVEAVKEAKNLAVVSGLSAEKADNLSGTMKLLGVDVGLTQGAMFRLAQEVDSGASGLTRLGIEVRKSNGEFKAEGELFLEVRDRISQMGSAGERNAALIDIFGRSGRALASVFSLSREEFGKWMEKVGAISSVTDETVKKTDAYTRSVAELDQRYDALKQNVGERVIPTLTEYLGLLNKLVEAKDLKTTVTVVFQAAGAPDPSKPFGQQLVDILLGADLARGVGRLPGFRGAGASGSWDDATAPRRLTDTELQAARLVAQGGFNTATQGLDRDAALRQQGAALGTATEGNALADELAALGRRQEATRAYYAELRRLAAERPDYEKNNVREIELAEAAALNAIVVQRTDVQKRLQVMGREYTTATADEAIKRNVVERDQAEKTATFTREVTAQLLTSRITAIGTEEEKFIRAEQVQLDAFERRVFAQAELDGDYLGAYQRVAQERENATARVNNKIREIEGATATAQAKLLRDSTLATETASEKVQREYREQFHTWDQLRANGLLSEGDFQARIQRLKEDTLAKSLQGDQAELQRQLANLTTITARKQNEAVLHASIRAQEQQRDGDYFGFLVTQFDLAAAKGMTTWQGIATIANDTVAGMKSAVSDFAFNFVAQTGDMLDAFENFGKGLLRSITNVLADTAVTKLLEIGKPVASAAFSAVSEFAGPALSALGNLLFHKGGIVGQDGGLRLAGDEVGVIAQRGESILPRDVTAMLQAQLGGGDLVASLRDVLDGTMWALLPSGSVHRYLWDDSGEGGRTVRGPNLTMADPDRQPSALQRLFAPGSASGDVAYAALTRALAETGWDGVGGTGSFGVPGVFSFPSAVGKNIGGGNVGISATTGVAGGAFTGIGNLSLGSSLAAALGLNQSLVAAIVAQSPALASALFGSNAQNPEFGNLGVAGGLLGKEGSTSVAGKALDFALGLLSGGSLLGTMFTGVNLGLQALTALMLQLGVSPTGGFGVNGSPFSFGPNDLNAAITEGQAAANANIAAGLGIGVFSGSPNTGLGLGGDSGGNFNVSAFHEGGIARVLDGEVMTPRPWADEFPALSRALERREFSFGEPSSYRARGGDGAELRALVTEVRGLRRELAAVVNRPVVVKVGQRTIFETVRDAGKDAVKNGERWVSERGVYPEKA